MTLTLATFLLVLAPGVAISAAYFLARTQLGARRRLSTPLDWTPELSLDRYRPMFRLLEEDDIRFLRSQPGATLALVNRLRRQRYLVFRGYLRTLQGDFERACEILTLLAVQSESDRQDILRDLVVSRVKFTAGLVRVHWRLLLYRWNVAQVPVGHLVGLFESLQLELLVLRPAPESSRA
ncbi:MAG TPA: hypothetical protein VHW09_22660 [Bryobacteraceae bacterium]|jgi:hypothetical protein|nr:hypothetical protein [Bryobacteraceae bacterium]